MIPGALTQRWKGLATRERAILIIGGAIGLLSLVYLMIVDPWLEQLGRLRRQILRTQQHQSEIRSLGAQAMNLRSRLAAVEAKLQAAEGRFSLLPFLEEAATATQVRNRIAAMQPQAAPPAQGFKEIAVEVRLEGVQLSELLALLVKIEDSPYLLQIKRVQLKPRFDAPHLLEATVLVATHEKA
jgi:hypothetical protein